ncbi:hypothetical protein ALC53_12939 [Atta colombica]|uniref:Uncharacterized protein n=1 Tax=Atta colombica TaxID=520822 RepID=A0A151HY95_9HYME|nr:hypothetical protein ALC53_12939 [Atta colombica]
MRGGFGRDGSNTKPSRTDRCGAVQSRAKSITHPPVPRFTCSIPRAYDETSKRARVDGKMGRGEDDEIRNEKVETSQNPGVRSGATGSMLPVYSSEASALYEVTYQ